MHPTGACRTHTHTKASCPPGTRGLRRVRTPFAAAGSWQADGVAPSVRRPSLRQFVRQRPQDQLVSHPRLSPLGRPAAVRWWPGAVATWPGGSPTSPSTRAFKGADLELETRWARRRSIRPSRTAQRPPACRASAAAGPRPRQARRPRQGRVSGVCGGWPDTRQALARVWTGAGMGEGLPAVRVHGASGSGRPGGRRVELRLTCPGGERPRGPTPPRAGCYGPVSGRDRAEGTGRRTPIAVSRWRGDRRSGGSQCMQPVCRRTAVCGRLGDTVGDLACVDGTGVSANRGL